jgi:hypothetical protein
MFTGVLLFSSPTLKQFSSDFGSPRFHQTNQIVSPKSKVMKASISYFPNETKRSQRTGKTPIYLRVSVNRLKAETRLSADVSDKELLKWDRFTMRFADRNLYVNHILNKLDGRFQEFMIAHSSELHRFTAAEIRDHVMGKPKGAEKTVLAYIDTYYTTAVESNQKLSSGTIKNYRKSIVHFKKYLKEINAQLKVLATMAKIPIRLSSHIARHTFRQLLGDAGIQDFAVVKRMMGHSSGSSIDSVYYTVTESRLIEARNLFQKYLSNHL